MALERLDARRGQKSWPHQSKARHTTTKVQIYRLASRIDDLAERRAARRPARRVQIIQQRPRLCRIAVVAAYAGLSQGERRSTLTKILTSPANTPRSWWG